ncbi:MAG: hypothetical protein H6Q75_135 [Firmicutes bacterium]|nr:hypothetical protein [Bacillota bacterium]
MVFSDSKSGGRRMPLSGVYGVKPEVLAAISAGLSMTMGEMSAEEVAAVTAAIVHEVGCGKAIRFKQSGSAWTSYGRQKIMDSRQML